MATYTPTSSSGTTYSSLNVGDIIQGNYTGGVIPVTVPAGTYKLECYGAQGGYGRALTQSTTGDSTTVEQPAKSDFTIYDILYANANLHSSGCYLIYVGATYGMEDNLTGYVTLGVNTSGNYRLVVTY